MATDCKKMYLVFKTLKVVAAVPSGALKIMRSATHVIPHPRNPRKYFIGESILHGVRGPTLIGNGYHTRELKNCYK